MAKLTPGSLLKLLDGMNSGVKPTSEYRNSLLQVTDIMPVDLDEKSLWPKQGFCVKVSDSSHSIYVSLPSDLVLSNAIQLGQFVFVEKLEPGSPVPVAKGVKPVPGRQLFVGMPEPILGLNSKLCTPKRGSWVADRKDENMNLNPNGKLSSSRRSSWVIGPKTGHGICELSTPFDRCTPVKKCGSVISSRSSSKILRSPFDSGVGKISVTSPNAQSTRKPSSPNSSSKTGLSFNLPQKLSLLGKEAVQQQARAQKTAHQALRNASATEILVLSLKNLSGLTKLANPDDPTECFERFLEFHNQINQAITNMVSIKSATETTNKDLKDTMRKHPLYTSQQKSTLFKNKSRSPGSGLNDTIKLGKEIEKEAGNWFMEFLEKSMERGVKKSNLGGGKVPWLVLKKVMNWVEKEGCDSSKREVNPKAVDIARKLRIKLRNY